MLSKNPSVPGIILFLTTILTLVVANSNYVDVYNSIVYYKVTLGVGAFKLSKPLDLWVNEGLMAIFFLHVGIEIKRERCSGVLQKPKEVFVPAIAAVGGMLAPALIYFVLVPSKYLAGWAIPTATDIAFSLAICSLLGNRVPNSFRMLLMTIAIFDDLGAVIIIALFYSSGLSILAGLLALSTIAILYWLNKFGVKSLLVYYLLGFVLWLLVTKSGVHATLAGFVLGLMLPIEKLDQVEKKIKPWVSYAIMPLFAVINAGVGLSDVGIKTLSQPITLGIVLGLALGKPLGIFLAVKPFNLKALNNKSILALGALCGVGFTMSLFIGTLAFLDQDLLAKVKMGVLFGSLLMGLVGFYLLYKSYGANDEYT